MTSRRSKPKTPAVSQGPSSKRVIGQIRPVRKSSQRGAVAPLTVAFWGSPLEASYRALFLQLEPFSGPGSFNIAHRHHGLSGSGDEAALVVAENIEVATPFGRRHQALRWFVTQGRTGMLPPRALATELDIDPDLFEAEFFAGEGRIRVEKDLRESKQLHFRGPLLVMVGRVAVVGPPSLETLLGSLARPSR
jgi:hypothetical protein